MKLKFRTKDNKLLFIIENKLNISVKELDSMDERGFEGIIKRSARLKSRVKDSQKSKAAKKGWKGNKWKYLKGISRYHTSTEGKRFHRALGSFLATKDLSKGFIAPDKKENYSENYEVLKSLSSALTHGLIETEYYDSIISDAEYSLFIEEFIPVITKVLNNDDIDKYDIDYLYRIVDPNILNEYFGSVPDNDDNKGSYFKFYENLKPIQPVT